MAFARVDFLLELVKRRIVERYVGSTHVLLWVLCAPLFPLLANLFVFYYVARLPQAQEMGPVLYALFIFTGLLPYRSLQRAMAEGCEVLAGNIELLRSAVFPVHFLSVVSVGGLVAEFGVQLLLLIALLVFSGVGVGPAILLLPVALLLLFVLMTGMSWLLVGVGYAMRETAEIVNTGMLALLYLTPVMYPKDAVPRVLQPLIELNPLTHLVYVFRDVFLPSASPHWWSWAVLAFAAAAAFGAGWAAMVRIKRYAGDLV